MIINRYSFLSLLITFNLLLGFVACDNDAPDKEQLIAEAIATKEKEYRAAEYEKCLATYRNEAETEIDSILRIRAKTGKIDTLSPPSRFTRPERPEIPFKEFKEPKPLEIAPDSNPR